jgi:hypothetical protein
MRYRLVAFSGVLVLRRITTSDVSARQAQSQVNPFITDLDALFTEALAGIGNPDLVQVCAERRRCSDPIIELSSSLGNAILQSTCSCALLCSIYFSPRDVSSDFQSVASPLAEAALFLE